MGIIGTIFIVLQSGQAMCALAVTASIKPVHSLVAGVMACSAAAMVPVAGAASERGCRLAPIPGENPVAG